MPIRDQYYNTNDDTYSFAQAARWLAQTFTISVDHTITSVKLLIYRVGSPGTITVGIRTSTMVDADLCSGTTDGDVLTVDTEGEWITITLGAGYAITDGTTYGIVVRATAGDADNYVCWRRDATSPTYTGGQFHYSDDSGANWMDVSPARDFMFEEWGTVPTYTIPIATTSSVRLARPYLGVDLHFDVDVCEIDCVGLQPYFPLGFTVPICAITCMALQGIHSHLLNHPIIKPEYFDAPRLVNRVYAVGVDTDGNTVYGEAKDAAIEGEVLQIYPDSMIPTQADAETIAVNILAKARLGAPRGQILIPPAIHQELWDVIKINDTICDQTNATYRVAGWTFVYQPFISNQQESRYEHLVKLTAV